MSEALEINLRSIARVQGKLDRLAGMDFSGMLERVGGVAESQTHRRLQETKRDPDGNPWKDWSRAYAASNHGQPVHEPHPGQLREAGGHSILYLEGHLDESIEWQVEGGDTLILGSNLEYAGRQNAERQFLGVGEDDQREIEDVVGDWIEGVLA